MKKAIVSVLALAVILSLSPNASAAGSKTGLSYTQVTQYLSNFITLQKSSSVRGQTRYMGQSGDKLAMLEVIGDRRDISQATLAIGLPSDSQRVVMRNGAMLLRFIMNVAPGWSGGTNWAESAIKQATSSPGETVYTVRGNKRIEIIFEKPLGMILATVKHK